MTSDTTLKMISLIVYKRRQGTENTLCSGLYMPSVTTVLSGTESEKSKAGLRNWNINNPGKLEEAGKRGTAIHHACENYFTWI